jgi:5-methylcytosine-specific restriction endonuclease McrA
MGKRRKYEEWETTNSKITAVIRRYLWMWSKERAYTIKRDKKTCRICGVKGKDVKLNVHHTNGVDMEAIREEIRQSLLCHPDFLITLCPDCHSRETACQIAEEVGL